MYREDECLPLFYENPDDAGDGGLSELEGAGEESPAPPRAGPEGVPSRDGADDLIVRITKGWRNSRSAPTLDKP